MFRSKYGYQGIVGVCLLLFAMPQLTLEYGYNEQSIFSFLWVVVATLFISANWRRMVKAGLFVRLQRERERREKWLEVQKRVPLRRRGKIKQMM